MLESKPVALIQGETVFAPQLFGVKIVLLFHDVLLLIVNKSSPMTGCSRRVLQLRLVCCCRLS